MEETKLWCKLLGNVEKISEWLAKCEVGGDRRFLEPSRIWIQTVWCE